MDGAPRPRSAHLVFGCALAIGLAGPAIAADDRDPRLRGDVSARTFAEFCAGDPTPEQRARFDRSLESAESAVARRDLASADAALTDALGAVYRGGPETIVSIKCLGESPAARWWEARLGLDRLRAADASDRSAASDGVLRVEAIDRGTDGLVAHVRALEPRRFADAYASLGEIARRVDADRRFGAFLLPDEQTLERVARQARERLRPIAAANQRDALAREARDYTSAETQRERDAAAAVGSAAALAEALAGPGAGLPTDEATAILQVRTRASLEALREARAWNLDRDTARSATPESLRARERGDGLMARAGEAGASLALQEACYGAAERYFDFAALDERAKNARAERDALEPALRAAREKRERAMDDAAERLRSEAEALQRSTGDLIKSESEKKAFEEEADALEDELGF